jgi:hypothetical protein
MNHSTSIAVILLGLVVSSQNCAAQTRPDESTAELAALRRENMRLAEQVQALEKKLALYTREQGEVATVFRAYSAFLSAFVAESSQVRLWAVDALGKHYKDDFKKVKSTLERVIADDRDPRVKERASSVLREHYEQHVGGGERAPADRK